MKTRGEATNVVLLSHSEANALSKLLDQALAQGDFHDHTLAGVQQRLSDSIWLSGWMRENVCLELDPVEKIDLTEAILVLLEEHPWSAAECRALETISQGLSLANSRTGTSNSACERPKQPAFA